MTDHDRLDKPEEPRLESWKEIAEYLQRAVRTAKRWEKDEGLPVRRVMHRSRASVYAYASELETWLASREPASSVEPEAPRSAWRRAIAMPAALVLSLASAGGAFMPMEVAADQTTPMTERRVWAGPDVTMGSVSPDGRYSTAIDRTTGNLVIRDLETGNVWAVTDKGTWTESDAFVDESIFGPEGRRVAYGWYGRGGFQLRVSNLDGSDRRTLSPGGSGYVTPMDWSADGRMIAARVDGSTGSEIALFDAATGAKTVLMSFSWAIGASDMRFSPDDRFLAYDQAPDAEGREPMDVFVIAVDGSRPIHLVDHPAADRVMDWSPDGAFLVFSSDRSGTLDAWAIPVDEANPAGPPMRIKSSLPPRFGPVAATADGRFFFRTWNPIREVFTATLHAETGRVTRSTSPVSMVAEGINIHPAWSPDGRRLAFVRARPDGRHLVVRTMATGEEREVPIRGVTVNSPLAWSPDGRRLAFHGRTTADHDQWGGQGIHFLDPETGRTEPALLADDDGAIVLRTPQFSPDGTALYYRRQGGGGYSLIRWDLASGDREVLYSAPREDDRNFLTRFALSPDGRWVAFGLSPSLNTASQELYVMPSTGGTARRVLTLGEPASFELQAFGVDSQSVIITRRSTLADANAEIWRLSIDGGPATRIGDNLGNPVEVAVHPDGVQMAMQTIMPHGELWAIEHLLPPTTGKTGR